MLINEHMKNHKRTIGAIVGLLVVGIGLLIGWYSLKTKSDSITSQEVSIKEPVDVVMDFYGPWLDAAQSTSTDPYTLGLDQDPILSTKLRARLADISEKQKIDPVLCQNIVPKIISTRTISEQTDNVQILVLSKEPIQPGQAVVTLQRLHDGWYIDDIACSQGEVDTSGKNGFETKGVLFKDAPPPYDPNTWHLGFTEDDVRVKIVPLFFDSSSKCIDVHKIESVCDVNNFDETNKNVVMLRGDMTEAGVEVKQLEFLQ
jgi:hypothetical protein